MRTPSKKLAEAQRQAAEKSMERGRSRKKATAGTKKKVTTSSASSKAKTTPKTTTTSSDHGISKGGGDFKQEDEVFDVEDNESQKENDIPSKLDLEGGQSLGHAKASHETPLSPSARRFSMASPRASQLSNKSNASSAMDDDLSSEISGQLNKVKVSSYDRF